MPIERMPPETEQDNPVRGGTGPATTPEQQLRAHFGEILDLQNEQNAQIQLAEQIADERGLTGERRVQYMNAASRDISNRLFPPQRAYMPPAENRPPQQPRQQPPRPRTPEQTATEDFEDPQVPPEARRAQEERNEYERRARAEVLASLTPQQRQIYEDPNGDQDLKNEIENAISMHAGRLWANSAQRDPREANYAERRAEAQERFGEPVEDIMVTTQSGLQERIPWPESAAGKIRYFRETMNDIEGNFAEDNTGTHRQKLQEIYSVIPALQAMNEPDKKALGEKMLEEFTRRMYFHQAYMKFANANSADEAIQGANAPFDLVQNLLLRDLDHGYYADYEDEKDDPNNPGEKIKEKKTLAENKSLMVWRSFNWYHTHAEEIRRTAFDEQINIHNRLIKELEEDYGLDKVDATSSQLIAQRMWEISLRRAMEDEIINIDTQETYDMVSEKGRKKLEEDAKNRKVDFRSKVRGGNFYARRAQLIPQWLYTQWANYRFKTVEMVEGMDFNSRDMMAHIPGDLETYLKEELVKAYKTTPIEINIRNMDLAEKEKEALAKYDGANTSLDPNAASELAKIESVRLTEAIIGTKKDKGGGYAFKSDLVDMTQMVYTVDDLDKLKCPAGMSQQDFETEKSNRRKILQRYEYNEDREEGPTNSAQENAHIKISQHFKDGFFDFKRVRPPGAMIPASFKGPEDVRNLLIKDDGPLRSPRPESVMALGKAFAYMNAGQFGRSLELIKNYIEYERHGGYYGNTGISNEQAEIIINELGFKLEATGDEIAQAKRDLIFTEEMGYNNIKKPFTEWEEYFDKKAKEARVAGNTVWEARYNNMKKVTGFFGTMTPEIILFAHEARKSVLPKSAIREFLEHLVSGIFKEAAKGK